MQKQKNPEEKDKRISGHLEQINLYAAGIDIGSTSHYVAVPAELYHLVHTIRTQLKPQGIHDSWETIRRKLENQQRITVSLKGH